MAAASNTMSVSRAEPSDQLWETTAVNISDILHKDTDEDHLAKSSKRLANVATDSLSNSNSLLQRSSGMTWMVTWPQKLTPCVRYRLRISCVMLRSSKRKSSLVKTSTSQEPFSKKSAWPLLPHQDQNRHWPKAFMSSVRMLILPYVEVCWRYSTQALTPSFNTMWRPGTRALPVDAGSTPQSTTWICHEAELWILPQSCHEVEERLKHQEKIIF